MKTLQAEEYAVSALVTAKLEVGGDILYIEMGGVQTHVRALTSAMLLLQHRKQDSGIKLDGSNIHLGRHEHYRVFTMKAPERKKFGITTKAMIVSDQFTSLANDKEAFHILLPADHDRNQPPPNFFERLRLAIDVPISSEWQEWLWQKAQYIESGRYRRRLITVREGYNINAATVYTSTTKWLELVRSHLGLECIIRKVGDGYADDSGEWELKRVEENYPRRWTIFHNGERTTMEQKDGNGNVKTVPYVGHDLQAAMKYARDYLGIDLTLEGRQ